MAVGSDAAGAPAEGTATERLTRRLARGEEEAYREFYDLYAHRLYGYLFVVCRGNSELVGELLQQTMIKVARYVRVFEDEEVFWKWLTTLARSCWIDEGRKRNRYVAALERLWNWNSTRKGRDAEESAELAMASSIELLPEADRSLLTQKYVEGLSVREIAEAAGSSEKAIESRLTRARVRMKEIMLSRKDS